jgi:S1-C subfamily serine protease
MLFSACGVDPLSASVGIEADGCDLTDSHGNGLIVAPGLVLTSAHVLKGSTVITVSNGDLEASGTIVAFDPEMDLAYVAIDRSSFGGVIPIGDGHVDAGAIGIAYLFRDGEAVRVPVRIRRRINIRTEDIYVEGETNRPGFELDADIRAGDSGGVIVIDGEAVGVLWARSRKFEDRAYAIDPVAAGQLVRRQLSSGQIAAPVDVSRCY